MNPAIKGQIRMAGRASSTATMQNILSVPDWVSLVLTCSQQLELIDDDANKNLTGDI